VGGETVDLVRLDAGIFAGSKDRLQCQHELPIGRLAVPVIGGLADSHDRDLAAQTPPAHAAPLYFAGTSMPRKRAAFSPRTLARAPSERPPMVRSIASAECGQVPS